MTFSSVEPCPLCLKLKKQEDIPLLFLRACSTMDRSWIATLSRQKKLKNMYNSSKFSIPDTYNKKKYTMKPSEAKRFAGLYERHLKVLKLQGKIKNIIDLYSRAVRRIRNHFDCCPDQLTKDQLENYLVDLVESHS